MLVEIGNSKVIPVHRTRGFQVSVFQKPENSSKISRDLSDSHSALSITVERCTGTCTSECACLYRVLQNHLSLDV